MAAEKTPVNPDPRLYKFYCPANDCWCMSESTCVRRIHLLEKAIRASRRRAGYVNFEVDLLAGIPNLGKCQECEIGKKVMEKYRNGTAQKKKAGRPKLQPVECATPGCNNTARCFGLCSTCYQRMLRNTLLVCDTNNHRKQTREVMDVITRATTETGLPVNDIVWLLLIKGVVELQNRWDGEGNREIIGS